ncbi:MAG: autotransporter outer membrane beta-barrel domain-containing protein [Gammaproteobacteria bacterium]|nr:autotransporter outer membrane beta-barrel domain-containing protein [Gammaproteobacteria bacterium]
MALATIPRNAAHVREVRVTLPPYPPPPEMLEAPSLTYTPAPVAEGAAAVFRFEVVSPGNRTPLHTVPLTVCYDLERYPPPGPPGTPPPDGAAIGGARGALGADYVLPTGGAADACQPDLPYSIVIRPGQRVATLRVATVNDNEAEQDETFGLRIRRVVEASVDPSGMTASSNTTFAMATIEDDDGVRLSLSGPSRVAEGGRAEVEVRLGCGTLAPAAYPVTVMYTIRVEEMGDGTTMLSGTDARCWTPTSTTLSFTANSPSVQAIPDLCLSSSDNIPEAAEDDFIVISLSNAQRTDGVPNTIMIENPPEAPLRIRITDVADDPRLREQRLEVAGAMLTRAAMILAIPTISRRLDPDSGALAPGLALTVGGRQVVAGGGKEGVAPVPFTGIGIVMPAQSPTPRQLLNMPDDGDDGGAALQGLEGIVIAAASANDGLSPRQLLGDSGFALAQGEAGARTGTVIWGRGGYTKLEGEPVISGELADYKGDAWTFYLGADRRYGNFLIGMAAGYTHGDLELDANILPGLPGTSTFEQDMVSIVPYAAWQPSRAVSVWVLGGYGRGEVDIIEQEAGGTRREGASDSDLLLGAAGLTLRRPSQTPVDILLRLSTTAAQGTIEGGRLTGDSTVPPGDYGETTTNTQQVQAELELAGRFGAMAGTHVRPFLLLGAAQDFGDAAPNAVTGELGGGFDLLWPKLGLESNLKLQARITNKDGQISRRKYKEYLLTGGLRYDFGNDRRGLMLSLQPEFGATANTHALAGGAAIADAAAGALRRSLRRSLHGELAYGIGDARFWGTPGIVTIYGNGDVSGRQRQYGSGLRFEARRFALSAGAKRTRRSDGRPGYEFLLDGEYSF